jgi:hypothetical protein
MGERPNGPLRLILPKCGEVWLVDIGMIEHQDPHLRFLLQTRRVPA